MSFPVASRHPIGLVVDDDLRRSRLTVFFRVLLAIPQAVVLYVWGFAAGVALVAAWLLALVLGRVPEGLHDFLARYLRASSHLYAYLLLLANPWPPFLGEPGSYPIDVRIDPPAHQNRLTVLFRLVLAIPAMLLAYVFRIVNTAVAFLGWFVALATGRMPKGMRDLSAWMFAFEVQTYGYMSLLTSRYPSFAGGPTS